MELSAIRKARLSAVQDDVMVAGLALGRQSACRVALGVLRRDAENAEAVRHSLTAHPELVEGSFFLFGVG